MDIVTLPAPPPSQNQDRLVRFSAALALTGISRSKAYRLMADGQFPKPAKLGRASLFSERELQQWVSHHLNARQEG